MKKIILILTFSLTISCSGLFAAASLPDSQPKDKLPTSHAGMTSVTGVMIIMMAIGIGYAARKIYLIRSLSKEEA